MLKEAEIEVDGQMPQEERAEIQSPERKVIRVESKDFLPGVIRGWLVLQRSELSASSKQTVLESTETW